LKFWVVFRKIGHFRSDDSTHSNMTNATSQSEVTVTPSDITRHYSAINAMPKESQDLYDMMDAIYNTSMEYEEVIKLVHWAANKRRDGVEDVIEWAEQQQQPKVIYVPVTTKEGRHKK
jgi:hypothetical protein